MAFKNMKPETKTKLKEYSLHAFFILFFGTFIVVFFRVVEGLPITLWMINTLEFLRANPIFTFFLFISIVCAIGFSMARDLSRKIEKVYECQRRRDDEKWQEQRKLTQMHFEKIMLIQKEYFEMLWKLESARRTDVEVNIKKPDEL